MTRLLLSDMMVMGDENGTQRKKTKYERTGTLFQERYKSEPKGYRSAEVESCGANCASD